MRSISLPDPETDGPVSVERAIADRASRRSFADRPVPIENIGQLLWAAQGVTHSNGDVDRRAAPSAGATYPIVAYLEVAPSGEQTFEPGVYEFYPESHTLSEAISTTIHDELTRVCYGQSVIEQAPVTIVLAANYERTVKEYPQHGIRYVHIEAGHIAQNVHLVCEARQLHSCPVGAFMDEELSAVLELSEGLTPIYLLPIGYPG